jgi:hypothetical protein
MKQYYAGYNSYGTNVVGYHAIHVFDTAAERDAWVKNVNSRSDQPTAEAITARVAYRELPCLRTGMYDLEGTMVVENPNKNLRKEQTS